jgi:dynein heavy chain
MEKYLRDLQTTWSVMEFEQEIHARTACSLLRASEELIETLEDNQVYRYVVVIVFCDDTLPIQ